MGNVFHFRNCMIFIDCVYCQPLYPVLRFLKKTKQNKKNLESSEDEAQAI